MRKGEKRLVIRDGKSLNSLMCRGVNTQFYYMVNWKERYDPDGERLNEVKRKEE